jgi:hypothetical protein
MTWINGETECNIQETPRGFTKNTETWEKMKNAREEKTPHASPLLPSKS